MIALANQLLSATLLQAAIICLFIPFIMSGAIAFLRFVVRDYNLYSNEPSRRNTSLAHEHVELAILGLMLVPAVIGIVFLLVPTKTVLLNMAVPMPDIDYFDFGKGAQSTGAIVSPQLPALVPATGLLIWVIYAVGAARALLTIVLSNVAIARLQARQHYPLKGSSSLNVCHSAALVPPMITMGGKIILPDCLVKSLDKDSVELVIAHERAHWERADPIKFQLFALIDAVFWFNIFVKAQTRHCRQCAEHACDQRVIAGAPASRRAYAKTLVHITRLTAGFRPLSHGHLVNPVPSIILPTPKGDIEMRLRHILDQQKPVPKLSLKKKIISVAALLAIAVPATATQMVMAQSSAQAVPVFSTAPLDGKITSKFGRRIHPVTKKEKNHKGTDIRGDTGDPIVAPAAAIVTGAKFYDGYGNLLTLDHGGGYITRYGQLSAFEVEPGERVSAGQLIARVGSTGQSTGPHLHLELVKDGEHIDPQSMMTLGKN